MTKVKETTNSIESLYKKYSERTPKSDVDKQLRLKNPFISFDRYLGGGPPIGRMTTYSGAFSTAKTTLALTIAGYNKDKSIGFLDQEYEWTDASYKWVEDYFGIERDRITVLQPRYQEEAGQMISDLCDHVDIIIQDGITSISTLGEYVDDMEAYKMGADARILNKVLRKVRGKIHETDTTYIGTNKLYAVIGGYKGEVTEPGGGAVGFYPAQKLQLTKAKNKDSTGEVIGQKVNITVSKDKLSGSLYQKFGLVYDRQKGFDVVMDLVTNAEEFDIVNRSGSWYSYNGDKIGQGAVKVKQMLLDNPELMEEIRGRVVEKF